MITKGLRALSNSSMQQDYSLVNVKDKIDEIMSSIEEIFRSRGVTISYKLNNCDKDIKIQNEKIYQLLFSIISFRTKALMGELNPWIKVSVEFVSDKFIIQLFDSIGNLTDEEISVLKDPFVKRQGIEKGSHLELNSVKPLLDSLNSELIFRTDIENLIFEIVTFI
jgi:C4-dicarboxylate-specific signal transduction histidine kinase